MPEQMRVKIGDAAFKKARQAQRDAAATLAVAENALNSFNRHQPQLVPNANSLKLKELRAAATEARHTYDRALQDSWCSFVRERDTIQRELQEAIHKSYGALPEQVDQSTIALIQSGILDAAETSGLFRRFESENNTAMMRIVGKYASERAEQTDNLQQRDVFLSVAQDAADSKGAIIGHVSSSTTLNIYAHVTDEMRRTAAVKIDQGIGKTAPQPEDQSVPRKLTPSTFQARKGQRRKAGTGYVTQINEKLWEGRYSPIWPDGKKRPRNVYAHSEEECEKLLAEMIVEMKTEIAAERDRLKAG